MESKKLGLCHSQGLAVEHLPQMVRRRISFSGSSSVFTRQFALSPRALFLSEVQVCAFFSPFAGLTRVNSNKNSENHRRGERKSRKQWTSELVFHVKNEISSHLNDNEAWKQRKI
jgi:hypothetical protein